VKQRLSGRDRRDEVFEDVELDADVLERVGLPQFGVGLCIGHDGEEDVLDDLQDVLLDQLPGQAVRDAGVNVVEC
jgi:hypothetical protein